MPTHLSGLFIFTGCIVFHGVNTLECIPSFPCLWKVAQFLPLTSCKQHFSERAFRLSITIRESASELGSFTQTWLLAGLCPSALCGAAAGTPPGRQRCLRCCAALGVDRRVWPLHMAAASVRGGARPTLDGLWGPASEGRRRPVRQEPVPGAGRPSGCGELGPTFNGTSVTPFAERFKADALSRASRRTPVRVLGLGGGGGQHGPSDPPPRCCRVAVLGVGPAAPARAHGTPLLHSRPHTCCRRVWVLPPPPPGRWGTEPCFLIFLPSGEAEAATSWALDSCSQLVAPQKAGMSKWCFLAYDVIFQERSGEYPTELIANY